MSSGTLTGLKCQELTTHQSHIWQTAQKCCLYKLHWSFALWCLWITCVTFLRSGSSRWSPRNSSDGDQRSTHRGSGHSTWRGDVCSPHIGVYGRPIVISWAPYCTGHWQGTLATRPQPLHNGPYPAIRPLFFKTFFSSKKIIIKLYSKISWIFSNF